MIGWIIIILTLFLSAWLVYKYVVDQIHALERQSFKRKCMESYYPQNLYTLDNLSSSSGSSYDKSVASDLLRLALNVELSNCTNLGPLVIPPGFSATKINGIVEGTQRMLCYILKSTTTVIIIFTGTVFTDEWDEDMELGQVEIPGIQGYKTGVKSAQGFYDMYMSVQPQIKNYMSSVSSEQRVFITGHSLGGCLSTLCALDLSDYNPVVYTFSSPRVFNLQGAQLYDALVSRTYRVFNTEDFFTTIPFPVAFDVVSEHIGNGISFTSNLGSLAGNHTEAYALNFGLGAND